MVADRGASLWDTRANEDAIEQFLYQTGGAVGAHSSPPFARKKRSYILPTITISKTGTSTIKAISCNKYIEALVNLKDQTAVLDGKQVIRPFTA